MIIQNTNPTTDDVPKSFLSISQPAGVGTVYIKSTNGFQANWAMQIGNTGEAESEVILASASTPSGTQIVTAGSTMFAHAADTPVFAIKYNKVVFAKSATGTAGTATPLSSGTVGLTPNFEYTQFDDTSALSTDAYQTYFLNSATLAQTANSDWQVPGGYTFYSLAKMVDRVRGKLFNSRYINDDDVIKDWLNEWRDEMANAVTNINESYSTGSTSINFSSNGLGTVTDPMFSNPIRLWVSYDNGNTQIQSVKTPIQEIYPTTQSFFTSRPRHAWINSNVFQVVPAQSGGVVSLLYAQFGNTLVEETDELPQPMRSYTKSFIDYALAQAYSKDEKGPLYDRYMNAALQAKVDFVDKITNRDYTGENYVTLREVTDGNDGYWGF